MRSTSILVLTASLVASILAAPSCTPSSNEYSAQKMVYLFNEFCTELNQSNFATKQKYYDNNPVIALNFALAAIGDCSLKECLISFGSLVSTCDKDDKSISGAGNFATSCGTYSFEVKDASITSSLGTPEATITAKTIQTYDIATLTSSPSSSSSSSSSPLSSSSTPSSYQASTTSEAQLESTYAPSTNLYLNATTSTAFSPNSSTEYQSATLSVTPSTSLPASATPTKPVVGDKILGSDASVLRVGGLSLVVVAGLFGVFL
ncbi:uncharacterized protein RSE6_08914 [Rhynchosporium secalis]|uniref:Uncharacterized protein n=1 Tax=Rhynchosporium secalis TaxID=38038 RepID=A0A1E1MGP2_RHYSE|nr:uncharacterized protein RSE6_08914 [Rhynchosporium secalis]